MTSVERENVSHLLASMHLILRQQDTQDTTQIVGDGQYGHITNTSFEKFVERSVYHKFFVCNSIHVLCINIVLLE